MKKVLFKEEARIKLIEGVDIIANAVKCTLGPSGKHVAYRNNSMQPVRVTKDGVTVARTIKLSDTFHDMGASLVKEVAQMTLKLAGDGTTTATIIAQALIHKGLAYIKNNKFRTTLSMEAALGQVVDIIIDEINKVSKDIEGTEDIKKIALIASNADKEIGDLIALAVDKVGKDGVITISESNDYYSHLEIKEGMSLPTGFMTPAFITDWKKGKCELKDARVLLCNGTLPHFHHLHHIFKNVIENKIPLIIMANNFTDDECQRALIKAKQKEGLKACIVQTPGIPSEHAGIIEDVAFLTGAVPIDPHKEKYAKSLKITELGTAELVTISIDETIFKVAPLDNPIEETDNYKSIKIKHDQCMDENEKEFLKKRMARLTNGIAVIHVGGTTSVEVSERKDRVEDAVCATKAALECGICPGGGTMYIHACKVLDTMDFKDESMQAAATIFKEALQMPLRQIIRNCALDDEESIVNAVINSNEFGMGFNGRTGKVENLLECGVIDPTKVLVVALSTATSITSNIINTDTIIGEDQEAMDKMNMSIPFMVGESN